MSEFSLRWFTLTVDVSLKVLLVAAAVGFVLSIFRIRTSNLKYAAWLSVLLAMFAVPLMSPVLPAVSVPLPSRSESYWLLTETPAAPIVRTEIAPIASRFEPTISSEPTVSESHVPNAIKAQDETISRRASALNWFRVHGPGVALAIWACGALLMAGRLILAVIVARHMVRRSVPILERTHQPLNGSRGAVGEFSSGHSIGDPVDLRESLDISVPLTTGILQTTVLLPLDWKSWPPEKLDDVLVHEQTHVKRRDCLTAFLVDLAACLYWFHPQVWWLRRRLAVLAEECCDDAAVGASGNRTGYARHLLEIASVLSDRRGRINFAGLSMARRSSVESRINAILDVNRPLSRRLTWSATLLVAAVVLPIAMVAAALRPAASAQEETSRIATVDQVDQNEKAPASPFTAAETRNEPGIVTGRVVRADDGTPLSNVKILLRSAQKYVGSSDETGQFRFEKIPPGEYRIWAHKENLVSSKERLFGEQIAGSTGGRFASIQLPMKPGKQVRVTVTSAETGRPIEGANVRFGYPDRRLQVTGKDGITVVPGLLGEPYEITVEATGRAREGRHIDLARSDEITNIPITLVEGGEIHGTVTGESGQPLDHVDVVYRDTSTHVGYHGESPWSNAAGEFRHHYLPLNTAIKVSVSKKDFLFQEREVVLSADQRKMQLKFQMAPKPKGGSIAGIVTDQTGKPVAGAKVFDSGNSFEIPKATTDAAGSFVLHDMQRSYSGYEIVTRAKGFSTARLSVKPGPESKPQQVAVKLQPGHKIRARVQTVKGEPLPGVYVEANGGIQAELGDSTRTDSNGIFEFDTLPKESSFRIYTAGYSMISDRPLELDGTETVTVVMEPSAVIRGRVVDAESGQPIQHFNVRVGFTPDRRPDDAKGGYSSDLGNPGLTVESKDGLFTIGELINRFACSLTVQAEGYERTVIRRAVAGTTKESVVVKVALTRRDPAKFSSLSGQVLDHRGKPVTGAQLRLIVSATLPQDSAEPQDSADSNNNWYQIKSGQLADRPQCDQFLSLVSDADGRFEFKKILPGKFLQLAYWGDQVPQGRSLAFDKTQASVNQTITIKLPEPAKVTGTFDLATFPDAGSIHLELRPSESHQYEVKLKEGQTEFQFRNLPPGEYAITVRSKPVRSSENERLFSLFPLAVRELSLKAGETSEVHFDKPDKPR